MQTSRELSVQPVHVVVVRGADIIAVALASSEAVARRAAEPYRSLPGVEVAIEPLPVASPDLAATSDLAETITRTIVETKVAESLVTDSEVLLPSAPAPTGAEGPHH